MERKVVDKYHVGVILWQISNPKCEAEITAVNPSGTAFNLFSLNCSDKWIAITKDTLDKYWLIKNGFSSPQISAPVNKINDNVNHPSHYNQGGIETIDYIKSRLTREEFQGFCKGNILKYCSRSNLKNGEEDLRKMNYYSNELMQVLDEKV